MKKSENCTLPRGPSGIVVQLVQSFQPPRIFRQWHHRLGFDDIRDRCFQIALRRRCSPQARVRAMVSGKRAQREPVRLFRVADPRRLQIVASLPPADAARVKSGDRVELTAGDGQAIEGRVRSATGVVDSESRAATVVITPSAGGSLLVPGQLVRARIFASGGSSSAGVTVPSDAVQTLGDRSVVFVRTAKGFRAQTVRVGTRSGGMAQIVAGLSAGSPIATTNAFLLKAELGKESAE